jgi:hypothetical protein
MKVHIQKQVWVKSRCFLLHFYRDFILIYAFLPVWQNIKGASMVKVHCNSSQPPSHGFLDCLISLIMVIFQVNFQGPEQVVVWGGQIQTVGWMGEQFPAILCSSVPMTKQGTNLPISKNLHHLLDCMVPYFKLCCSFSDCYPLVLSDVLINFLLVAFICSSSRSTIVQLISDVHVPVVKMFYPPSGITGTHAGITIHTKKSLVDNSCWVSLFHKNSMTAHGQNGMLAAIFSQCMMGM